MAKREFSKTGMIVLITIMLLLIPLALYGESPLGQVSFSRMDDKTLPDGTELILTMRTEKKWHQVRSRS